MKPSILLLLKSLEKNREIFWNITPEAGQLLNLVIKNRKYKKVLEIGTSNGYSGIWIAEALRKTGGHLYTMESNLKERIILAAKNFKKSGLAKHITLIPKHAPEEIPLSPKIFDLAFFDATKNEHLSYFLAIKDRIQKGGMIITDNIYSHTQALKPYLKTISTNRSWQSVKINIGTGLLLSLKIK